jgi:hypothetical protein
MAESVKGPQPAEKQIGEAKAATRSEGSREGRSGDPASAVLAIRMYYKGEELSTGLPFDQAIIMQLVLEAEVRSMGIDELFSALILAVIKKDLFLVLSELKI